MNVTVRNYLRGCDLQTPTEKVVTVSGANTATPLAATTATGVGSSAIRFQKLWIYPYSAMAGGLGTPNTSTVFVGKSQANQPDGLPVGTGPNGISLPIVYEFPLGQCGDLRSIYFQSTNAADGVFISYT